MFFTIQVFLGPGSSKFLKARVWDQVQGFEWVQVFQVPIPGYRSSF